MGEASFRAVLFTDLVDSTALATSIGDNRWDEIRRRHIDTLRSALLSVGGTEIKTIGDAVMASFTGAAAALDAAVRMQVGVRRDNRATPVSLQMRVGVSAGDVVEEEGDVHGEAVVEAARLCAAAQGGQILVADVVRVLAGSRTEHELVGVGAIELKGLPQPVVASEVRWHDDRDASTVPLPPVIAEEPSAPLVGRDDDVRHLLDAWKRARAGAFELLLVSGEPGIGKTRLAAEIGRAAHGEGAVVLWGRCDEVLGAPFRPWVEAVQQLLRTASTDDVARWVGEGGPHLARLVPELATRLAVTPGPGADPETERLRMYDALVGLLTAIAADGGLVVVLDDAHWADGPSLQVLRHVVHGAPGGAALVVTYRDTDLDRAHPLAGVLGDLRRYRVGHRFALAGLDVEGTAALIAAWAGDTPDPGLVAAVCEETEGNPFFVEEVLQHLVEAGAVRRDGDRWELAVALDDLGIPEGVREAIGRRLERLDDEVVEVLRVAAVVGREFDIDVLARASARGEDAVLDALEAAVGARLVAETPGAVGRFGFAHALVQATLADELSTTRRVRLHGAIAEVLVARRPDEVEAVAYHFGEAASSGVARQAAVWSATAAARAIERLSFEEADAWAARGLAAVADEGPDLDDVRADLLVQQAWAAALVSDSARHLELVQRAAVLARRLGDHERLLHVATSAFVLVTMFPDPVCLELAEEVLAFDELPRSIERVRLLLGVAVSAAITDPSGRGIELGRQAMQEASSFPDRDDEALATARMARSFTLLGLGHVSERRALLAEMDGASRVPGGALDLLTVAGGAAGQRRPPELAGPPSPFTLMLELAASVEAGDRRGYADALGRLDPAVAASSQPNAIVQPYRYHAVLDALAGRLDLADERIESGYAELVGDDPTGGLARLLLLTWMAAERGVPDPRVDDLRAVAPFLAGQGAEAPLAWCDARCGDLAPARTVLDALLPGHDAVPWNWSRSAVLQSLAEVAVLVRDDRRAALLLDLLEPYSGSVIEWYATVGVPGAADRFRGMLCGLLGRHDDALRLLDQAEQLELGFEAPMLAVRTRCWRARTLLEGRDPTSRAEAAALLDGVVAEAGAYGLTALVADAEELRTRAR